MSGKFSEVTSRVLQKHGRHLKVRQFEIGQHGLSAKIELENFTMENYTPDFYRDSPIHLLISLVMAVSHVLLYHPDFIMRQFAGDLERWTFTISFSCFPKKDWYMFLSSGIHSINFKTSEVKLNKNICLKTKASFTGNRTYLLQHDIFTNDGTLLASVDAVYGCVDTESHSLVQLSETAFQKARFLDNNNTKPPKFNIKKVPDDVNKVVTRSNNVVESNIDKKYNHANLSYYFYIPNILFSQMGGISFPSDKRIFKKFTVLFKKESMVGSTLLNTAWEDSESGNIVYCRTTNGDVLICYIEAEYYEDTDVQSKL